MTQPVEVFFTTEGIIGVRGAATAGVTAQHAVAGGVVQIPFLRVSAAVGEFDQQVQFIVGEGSGCPIVGATGDVAQES